ncbi:hypothetical protein Sgou_51850 [Streptomyces gougerotii]|uniref:Uncharacterized protein n=2 Tax=Streptomyces diastaticus group TaxID=2849069 RepID=A0A8H9HN36_9ACTN|nr:hypothetical protein Sdia_58210 [Streptomyces diastaticus subsp. diastaticus]GFH80515.1 hypothetical protein Sgou_51850 [Streptomyces gougerotii]GGU39972.1 hypothetical protein GCM10015534_48190 [Streptomyces diastaticus subsp. diastaticus]GGU71410.1 hypothetical protein GCM10010227_27080 [Streptomyces gougerotii]
MGKRMTLLLGKDLSPLLTDFLRGQTPIAGSPGQLAAPPYEDRPRRRDGVRAAGPAPRRAGDRGGDAGPGPTA